MVWAAPASSKESVRHCAIVDGIRMTSFRSKASSPGAKVRSRSAAGASDPRPPSPPPSGAAGPGQPGAAASCGRSLASGTWDHFAGKANPGGRPYRRSILTFIITIIILVVIVFAVAIITTLNTLINT